MDRLTIQELYNGIDPLELYDSCFLNYLINSFLVIKNKSFQKDYSAFGAFK